MEEEICDCSSLSDYIVYYNEMKLHWSLDIRNYQTPLWAFCNKTANEH